MRYVIAGQVIALVLLANLAAAQCETWISGCWEWVSTEYADGSLDTPATVGYSVQKEFLLDGRYFEYNDEALVREDTWECASYFDCIGGAIYMVNVARIGEEPWFYWREAGGGAVLYVYNAPLHYGPTVTTTYEAREPLPMNCESWGGVKSLYR